MGERWFIVTGTSSGIGRAIAERLLLQGDRVYGLARRNSTLSEYERYTGREEAASLAGDKML